MIVIFLAPKYRMFVRFYVQLIFGVLLMILVILLLAIFGALTDYSMEKDKLMSYILDYSLFIIFVPLAVIFNNFRIRQDNLFDSGSELR